MLEGSHVQLNAIGPQEQAIYFEQPGRLAPFTTQCIRRHSRFATETREEVFPNSFVFGKSNTLNIPRSGDLLGDVFLEIRLPVVSGASSSDRWVDSVGYVLLKRVKLQIDDTIIHTQERLWYDIDDALFLSSSKTTGVHEMIGRGVQLPMNQAHTLFVPLKFFCCKNYHARQNFMPLLGIPGSTLSLTIESETFSQLTTLQTPLGSLTVPTTLDVRVLLEYVTLDAPERERLLVRPTSILFEDVQDVEAVSYRDALDSNGGGRIPLDVVRVSMREVNSPVKLLTWVSYLVTDVANKIYFAYRDDISHAQLAVNGIELDTEREIEYFKTVQKYYRVDNTGVANVSVHSFALDASSWQPSGQLNFDQINEPELRARLRSKREDLMVKVFVMCYKHIIFDKGRAMLKFI